MMGSETANELGPMEMGDMNATSLTVPQFEAELETLYKQRDVVKQLKASLEVETTKFEELKTKVLEYMEALGKNKYLSSHGTISVQNKFSVKVPQDPFEREKFFGWLKEKGIFEQYITVHSASLNSLFNAELEASGDPDFELPGIGKGTAYKILSVK